MDELKARIKKSWRGALIGGLVCAAIGWILLTPVGLKVAHWSYDVPFAVRGSIYPNEVAMVYLDEQSHVALKQPYDKPWNRSLHAKLLRRLTREHARAVIFDIVFADPGPDPDVDADFAKAIQENGRVVLAADEHEGNDGQQVFDPPYQPFFDACEGRCGSTALYHDNDQVNRYHLAATKSNESFSSEAWTMARFLAVPYTENDSNKFVPFNLNYYGPSGTIPSTSFYLAITNETELPPNFFAGKVVFVGARYFTKFSGERKDEYPTPFSYWYGGTFTCGVEVQATAFLNLYRHDFLFRIPARAEYAIMLLGGFIGAFGLALLRPLLATLTAILLAVLAFVVDYTLFVHFHLWFAWMIPVLVQIPMAFVWSIVLNSVQLYVEKRLVEQSLALYLSPKLVKKFANNPKLLKPGAEKQLLTILFSDIAGFTTISEGMDSDDLARLMNEYFQSAVQNCIHSTDGTVVKYIGDAIFAFWNAPDLQGDHAYRACEAALKFRAQDTHKANGKPLITRIGLHTGVANVGNFGSDTRVDYTAIGENINLASRMEGLNKYLHTRVLITSDTKNEIDGRLITRYLGLFRLKGFERAVGVYELMARAENEAETRELRSRFADALETFANRNFAGAKTAFQRVLEFQPDDGPSQFYLEQIDEIVAAELPDDWKGDITLKDK